MPVYDMKCDSTRAVRVSHKQQQLLLIFSVHCCQVVQLAIVVAQVPTFICCEIRSTFLCVYQDAAMCTLCHCRVTAFVIGGFDL